MSSRTRTIYALGWELTGFVWSVRSAGSSCPRLRLRTLRLRCFDGGRLVSIHDKYSYPHRMKTRSSLSHRFPLVDNPTLDEATGPVNVGPSSADAAKIPIGGGNTNVPTEQDFSTALAGSEFTAVGDSRQDGTGPSDAAEAEDLLFGAPVARSPSAPVPEDTTPTGSLLETGLALPPQSVEDRALHAEFETLGAYARAADVGGTKEVDAAAAPGLEKRFSAAPPTSRAEEDAAFGVGGAEADPDPLMRTAFSFLQVGSSTVRMAGLSAASSASDLPLVPSGPEGERTEAALSAAAAEFRRAVEKEVHVWDGDVVRAVDHRIDRQLSSSAGRQGDDQHSRGGSTTSVRPTTTTGQGDVGRGKGREGGTEKVVLGDSTTSSVLESASGGSMWPTSEAARGEEGPDAPAHPPKFASDLVGQIEGYFSATPQEEKVLENMGGGDAKMHIGNVDLAGGDGKAAAAGDSSKAVNGTGSSSMLSLGERKDPDSAEKEKAEDMLDRMSDAQPDVVKPGTDSAAAPTLTGAKKNDVAEKKNEKKVSVVSTTPNKEEGTEEKQTKTKSASQKESSAKNDKSKTDHKKTGSDDKQTPDAEKDHPSSSSSEEEEQDAADDAADDKTEVPSTHDKEEDETIQGNKATPGSSTKVKKAPPPAPKDATQKRSGLDAGSANATGVNLKREAAGGPNATSEIASTIPSSKETPASASESSSEMATTSTTGTEQISPSPDPTGATTTSTAPPSRVVAPSSSETENMQSTTSQSSGIGAKSEPEAEDSRMNTSSNSIPTSDPATWPSEGAEMNLDNLTSTTTKELQSEAESLEAEATKALEGVAVEEARAKAKATATAAVATTAAAALAEASRDRRIPPSLQDAAGKDLLKKFWNRRTAGGVVGGGQRGASPTAESLLGEQDARHWDHEKAGVVAETTPEESTLARAERALEIDEAGRTLATGRGWLAVPGPPAFRPEKPNFFFGFSADPRQSGPPSDRSTPSDGGPGPGVGSSLLHQRKRIERAPVIVAPGPDGRERARADLGSERSELISEIARPRPRPPSSLSETSSGNMIMPAAQRRELFGTPEARWGDRRPNALREFRRAPDEAEDDVIDNGGHPTNYPPTTSFSSFLQIDLANPFIGGSSRPPGTMSPGMMSSMIGAEGGPGRPLEMNAEFLEGRGRSFVPFPSGGAPSDAGYGRPALDFGAGGPSAIPVSAGPYSPLPDIASSFANLENRGMGSFGGGSGGLEQPFGLGGAVGAAALTPLGPLGGGARRGGPPPPPPQRPRQAACWAPAARVRPILSPPCPRWGRRSWRRISGNSARKSNRSNTTLAPRARLCRSCRTSRGVEETGTPLPTEHEVLRNARRRMSSMRRREHSWRRELHWMALRGRPRRLPPFPGTFPSY